MQREVIRWLQSLDLSQQVRYPQQDLSNGFLFAEIASRYDRQVAMHCYIPGCSTGAKRSNWTVLLADMKRIGFSPITKDIAESIMQGKPGVAVTLLNQLYEFFCGKPAPASSGNLSKKVKSLWRALEGCSDPSEGTSATSTKEDDHSLPLMASEVRIDERLRQPGFAQPTAAALLRVVNSGPRAVRLVGDVPQDDLKIKKRNECLLAEHEILYKVYKRAEPHRFEPKNRFHLSCVARQQKKRSETLKTKRSAILASNEGTTVHLELENNRAADILHLRPTADGFHAVSGEQYGGDTPNSQVFNIFKVGGASLRLTLSKLLGVVLCSEKLSTPPLRFGDTVGASDVFSAFVGQCDSLPFSLAAKCWETLTGASGHVAEVLLQRPTEYLYLLRVMDFLFSPESMSVRMLHVSGTSTTEQPSSTDDLVSTSNCTRLETSRSTSKKHSTFLPASEDVQFSKHSRHQSTRSFNLAAAHGFLYNVGMALNSISPPLALSLIEDYYIPAISPSLSVASSMALEAVSRLVVAHSCGDGTLLCDDVGVPKAVNRGSGTDVNTDEDQVSDGGEAVDNRPSTSPTWEPLQQLVALLKGPLKEAFVPGAAREEMNSIQRRTQYGLFVHHVLHYMRDILEGIGSHGDENGVCVRTLLPHGLHFSSLIELCGARLRVALMSPSPRERAVGVATLVELVMWGRWDVVVEPLVMIINETRRDGPFSAFSRPHAETWELRVFLLELFSASFRRILVLLVDDIHRGGTTDELQGNSEEEQLLSSVISAVNQIDLDALEEAMVKCMRSFSTAPLLQRQLMLQIVGSRLLPEKQRTVASAWVECLFELPAEELEFMLDVDHTLHLRNWGNNSDSQIMPRRTISPLTQDSFSSVGRAINLPEGRHLRSLSSTAKTSGECIPSETPRTEVRVLLGRVESAYVITPLNHTWNVFAVVQTVLIFQNSITTFQLFSVIYASLMSPQGRDEELQSLLMDLRVTKKNESNAPTDDAVTSEEVTEVETVSGEKTVESNRSSDVSIFITLEDLVTSARTGSAVNQGRREDARDDDKGNSYLVEPYPGQEVVGFSATYSVGSHCTEEIQQPCTEMTNGAVDSDATIDDYVEAFWLSVLCRIKPQLAECTIEERTDHEAGSHCQPSQHHRRKKRDADRDIALWNVCRVSKGDDIKRLRRLAGAILLNFFKRFGGSRSRSARPSSLDAMSRARLWLSAM